jgi:hypothetical protein
MLKEKVYMMHPYSLEEIQENIWDQITSIAVQHF